MTVATRVVSSFSALGLLTVAACAQSDEFQNESVMHDALEADRKLAACLEEAGHDDPLVDADVRRLEDPLFDEAVEACAAQLDIKVPRAGDTTRAMAEFVRSVVECLQAEGWDVPEPVQGPHGALRSDGLDASIPEDQSDAFIADLENCESEIASVTTPSQ